MNEMFKKRMPIETSYNGEEITKIVIEDVSKVLSRVQTSINKAAKESKNLFKSIRKRYVSSIQDSEGYLVIGRGVSNPCNGDVFNEKIGNNIAFMKAKLNANIKKHKILCEVYNNFITVLDDLDVELKKVDSYIQMDLYNLRQYNSEYLEGIEETLGIESANND